MVFLIYFTNKSKKLKKKVQRIVIVLLIISSMDYLKYFLGEGTNPFTEDTTRQFAGGNFLTTPIESEFNICSVTLAFMMGYYANFSLSAPNEKQRRQS